MTTTTLTTWTRIFRDTFENAYNADPLGDLDLTAEQRENFLSDCRDHLTSEVDAILAPYGAQIIGNGDVIGPVDGDFPEWDTPEWDDLKESIGMIDFNEIIDRYLAIAARIGATFDHVGASVSSPALDKAAHEIQAAILTGGPLPTTAAGHPVCGAESISLDDTADYWLVSFEEDGVYVAGDPAGQFPDADDWPCIQIIKGDREAMSGLLAKYKPSF